MTNIMDPVVCFKLLSRITFFFNKPGLLQTASRITFFLINQDHAPRSTDMNFDPNQTNTV
jgi:hypothetical protein